MRPSDVSPMRSQKVNTALRDLSASFSQAGGNLHYEADELCPIHAGEVTIAVDLNHPQTFGCNKCVFEKKLEKPQFLVVAAKRTKKLIDAQHVALVKNLDEIEKLEPDAF